MVLNLISIVGARPQFIKAAAVSRAFDATPSIREILVHTGQHFDELMSAVFFDELSIPEPKYNLEVHGGPHGDMTGRMLSAIEQVLVAESPQAVIVYGDTNSTLAGALAAAKLHIPVVHVEAGLRSFNRRMPEEINRLLTDHLSELLFCPTNEAVKNLRVEGINKGVHMIGDVMYDATLFARSAATKRSRIHETLGIRPQEYSLCTVHRAENTDDPERFSGIIRYLEQQATHQRIVFPVHPRTRKLVDRSNVESKGLMLVDPVGYLDMHRLLSGATQVFTDSGGLQKEAYFHRVPCVTLREETEWVETVKAGWNRLWTDGTPVTTRSEIEEYGRGDAAYRIIDALKLHFSV
jgi:UDP-GlcNAc3NAcA epimerase